MKIHILSITLSVFVSSLISPLALAQANREPYPPGTKLTVTASKLSLRDAPSTSATRILTMPKGDTVVILEDAKAPVPFESEGIKGYWARVQYGQKTGYAFDGFMKPIQTRPVSNQNSAPMQEEVAAPHEGGWICIPGERVGPITVATTLADLKEIFGAANVIEGEHYIGEGETEPATLVYPNTRDQLTITWNVRHERPSAAHIDGEGSRWRTESGIKVGTPLATLEQLNGAPVHFTGFEWDYGGEVVDWRGGRLQAKHALGEAFGVSLNVTPTELTQDAYLSVIGDDVFTSDMPATKMVKPYVFAMTIGLMSSTPPTVAATPNYPNALLMLDPPQPGTKRYVLATRLNMRETPALDAAIVGRLAYGAEVEIPTDNTPRVPLSTGGLNGHWVKVRSGELEGYVFDAFILPFPAPPNPTTGLWNFADTSLGKDGAEQEVSKGAEGSGEIHLYQPYKYDARIDYINKKVDSGIQRETRLTMKGIAPEHAFLIAQRCFDGLGDMPFQMTPEGRLQMRTPQSTIWILSSPSGSVAIAEIARVEP